MRLTLWGSGCGTRRQIENTHRDLVGQDREGSAEYSGGAVDLAVVANRGMYLKIISYGAGVQSTALLVLSALGQRGVPKADYAVFADTGDEPQYIYDYLEVVTQWAKPHGLEVVTCSAGKLSEDLLETDRTFVAIPAWRPMGDGKEMPMRRQCTREYKITPIEKKIRELMGYKPRQRIKENVQVMLGISCDEASRVKPSRTGWIENSWPLIDARLYRSHCVDIVKEAGLPAPQKSSCHYCPYHSNSYFLWLKNNHPEDWQKAVDFDEAIRVKHPDDPMYVHRSLKPLGEVDLNDYQLSLFDEECEGYCGL